ncbi:unnamed protein product [Vitrella brassicaformis CCMP3155]|uniref:Uncharacterized protein n=1 Tax=Vitrella brassicaformis (strain CCMP3155) TaxID=1169540 RepID=A0A0G4FK20_VITBC|nr:unnamed protein product [Vitrella brassicaformis CCMP3155]|eukprot:CEM14122.1 unnamed protein product [Vitrella brassicaformis CCMP3155]
MPLAVAHNWGERATNVREIRHRHPWTSPQFSLPWTLIPDGWCRGTWVALVEGHAIQRAAIAGKRREREGGEGTADAAAMRDGDDPRSADEPQGTLEVLSFEAVELDDSIVIPYPPPSRAPPPAPPAPIHLPALKTVRNIAHECLLARVDRQWHTPAVKTLITRDSWAASWVKGGRTWLADCGALELLQLNGRDASTAANALSGLPADGKSLKALRTLRGVQMDCSGAIGIDKLREVMVARGVRQSIRELEIDMSDAIAHPEAVEKGVFALTDDGTCGRIDAELLSRSNGGPGIWRLIGDFAKRAGTVAYIGEDEAIPAVISDDTFPAAHTLQLMDGALDDEGNVKRALEIASHMLRLSCVKVGDGEDAVELDGPVGEVWRFLERLQAALVSSRGRERSLSVQWYLSASAFVEPVHNNRIPCLWGRRSNDNLPPVEEVTITVLSGVEDDHYETFYSNVMATITSFTDELKGHKKTYVGLTEADTRTDFQRRFIAQQAGISLLSGGPYKLSLDGQGLCVERRSAAT